MSQFDLTDEQRQIQEMARSFTADAITPHATEWDEKHVFPRDTIRQAAELGFGSIYVSEDSGGIGLGRLEAAWIMEAMMPLVSQAPRANSFPSRSVSVVASVHLGS